MAHLELFLTNIVEKIKIKKLELSSHCKDGKINYVFKDQSVMGEFRGLSSLFHEVEIEDIKINQNRTWYDFGVNYKECLNIFYPICPVNFKITAKSGN